MNEQNLLDLATQGVGQDEGLSLKPYKDAEGILTIGYGLNLEEGITQPEAKWLLQNRLKKSIQELTDNNVADFNSLDLPRQYVLVNMNYNLGLARLRGFQKTLNYITIKNFEKASLEMLDSKWAKQVGPRAIRLSEVMKTGKVSIKEVVK